MNLAVNATVQVPCILGTLGVWAQARKHLIAPVLGFTSELGWLLWAAYAGVWLVIPWSLLWAALYARVWWKWGKS